MSGRISWHEYFMAQAKLIALRATCTRLMVGAVIVRDRRVIAGGYNGSIAGDEHCIDVGCKIRDGHCIRTIHAEQNALMQCAKFGVSTDGAELYVTHFPCLNCTKLLIQAGIQHIYYEVPYRVDPYAIELLEKAGVGTTQIIVDLNAYVQAMPKIMPEPVLIMGSEDLDKTIVEHRSSFENDTCGC
ncbi:MAG: ComE operon protein 2 [Candidatus Carbobacillus sp.]|nr:ComE operon protein 2 [Candidatus Carbobacillus sp.]